MGAECGLNALQALIDYLKNHRISESSAIVYEPNGTKTPPDYSIDFISHSVLVEVRNSGDGFLVMPESDYLEPKERYERSTASMIDKIENNVKTWLDPSETIILMISSPVPLEKRGHLAKKIAKQLEIAYQSNSWSIDQKIDIQINTEDVKLPIFRLEAKLTNFYAGRKEYSAVKEILGASLQSPEPVFQSSLSEQAVYTLWNAIVEKSKKLEHLVGEKWLVLINNNPLLDTCLYSEAYARILKQCDNSLKSAFSKIFIIEGKVAHELIASS
jgi:hypothetical protein